MRPAETPAMFRVLTDNSRDQDLYERLGCPRHVPWNVLAPHEEQAEDNHDQSLRTLNRRGGLSPVEMANVLTGHKWSHVFTPEESVEIIKQAIAHHEASNA